MTSPLPAPLHAQAVALYARRVSVHVIARRRHIGCVPYDTYRIYWEAL